MILDSTVDRISHYLDAALDMFADRTAIRSRDVTWTYRQFGSAVDENERLLIEQAVEVDEPIIVAVSNEPCDLSAYLAIWRVGGVVVPVHIKAAERTVDYIMETTGARYVFTSGKTLDGALGRRLSAGVGDERLRKVKQEAPVPDPLLRGAALLVFTSGTTGNPKGVILGHSGYCGKLRQFDSVIPMVEGMTTLQMLQLTFSFGQWTSFLTLAKGGTLVIHERFSVEEALVAFSTISVDWFPVVPSMMRMLKKAIEERPELAASAEKTRQAASPRIFMAGGEPLPGPLGQAVRQMFPRSGIADVYGLTETNSADFILTPEDYDAHAGTIGRPSPGVRFKLVDPEGEVVSDGEPGELCVDTPFIMRGYLKEPQVTANAMLGSFLKTGDLGILEPSGCVRLIGRSKDIVCRGGMKISPLEIEDQCCLHPDVSGAAAVGVPDLMYGEALHVLVTLKPGAAISSEEVRQWLVEKVEKFKVPDKIHLVESLPQGGTGKLDRKSAREQLAQVQ